MQSAFHIPSDPSLFVFSLGCHSAPDMPFLLVQVQNLPYLTVELCVVLLQPGGKVLMYRGFGNAEMPGRRADRGAGFDHVHSHFTGPFLEFFCHGHPSDVSVLTEKPMPREMQICTLDSMEFRG